MRDKNCAKGKLNKTVVQEDFLLIYYLISGMGQEKSVLERNLHYSRTMFRRTPWNPGITCITQFPWRNSWRTHNSCRTLQSWDSKRNATRVCHRALARLMSMSENLFHGFQLWNFVVFSFPINIGTLVIVLARALPWSSLPLKERVYR